MTLKDAAQQALDAQSACNLSGVVHAFSRVLSECLWPEARKIGEGTQWVNTHPIAVIFADKIRDLTGSDYCSAYTECCRLSMTETTK
jgi:hypothetical protein